MDGITFFLSGNTSALKYAGDFLNAKGVSIAATPSSKVTHLLLPVPSLDGKGLVRGSGAPEAILSQLSPNVIVMGGFLNHPAFENYAKIDFLQDAYYLAENAAITADCALHILGNQLPVILAGCPILIIGWGRIGKCLAARLKALNADVTVAARKGSDRGTLISLGYKTVSMEAFHSILPQCRAVVNTAPAPVISREQAALCANGCVFLDLASTPGICGENVLWERGLPNRDAPESSGALIAQTALRLCRKEATP